MNDKKSIEMSADKITINGVTYVKETAVLPVTPGKRAVFVIDRGWMVAGDIVDESNGRIKLARALHIFKFESVGFGGMIEKPLSSKVDLRPLPNGFDIPKESEIFRVSVDDNWGIK